MMGFSRMREKGDGEAGPVIGAGSYRCLRTVEEKF